MNKHTLKKLLALCAVIAALMTFLVLPASAKSAGGFQYYLTEDWDDGEETCAIITGHKSAVNGTLKVPEKLNGHKVITISAAAFSGRKDITAVVLPDDLFWVEEFAFSDCTNLKTLTIGTASVERGAFSGCTALKTVKFTGYLFDCWGETPDANWVKKENKPLFNATLEMVHYKKDFPQENTSMKAFTGQKKTLTCTYENAKRTDTYHWCVKEGYGLGVDPYWDEVTESSVTAEVTDPGKTVIVCEVVNAKGDVVFRQTFTCKVMPSVGYSVRDVAEETWLYGVTQYTINHIRWNYVDPVLNALGVETY